MEFDAYSAGHVLAFFVWVWCGNQWAKGSPQPRFVRAIWYTFAVSELAALADLPRLDVLLTVACVLAAAIMFTLRHTARLPSR